MSSPAPEGQGSSQDEQATSDKTLSPEEDTKRPMSVLVNASTGKASKRTIPEPPSLAMTNSTKITESTTVKYPPIVPLFSTSFSFGSASKNPANFGQIANESSIGDAASSRGESSSNSNHLPMTARAVPLDKGSIPVSSTSSTTSTSTSRFTGSNADTRSAADFFSLGNHSFQAGAIPLALTKPNWSNFSVPAPGERVMLSGYSDANPHSKSNNIVPGFAPQAYVSTDIPNGVACPKCGFVVYSAQALLEHHDIYHVPNHRSSRIQKMPFSLSKRNQRARRTILYNNLEIGDVVRIIHCEKVG